MKYSIAILVALLFSLPAFASSELLCKGYDYDVRLSVDFDKEGRSHLGYARLTQKKNWTTINFDPPQLKIISLLWIDSEGSFDNNFMRAEFKDTNGNTYSLIAKGRTAQLQNQSQAYPLTCNWLM